VVDCPVRHFHWQRMILQSPAVACPVLAARRRIRRPAHVMVAVHGRVWTRRCRAWGGPCRSHGCSTGNHHSCVP
jgi:hypothetical protein